MAFFDDALKNAVPGGNISTPLMVAAGALLLGKMFGGGFGGGSSTAQAPAGNVPLPQAQPPMGQAPTGQESGGLLGGLGGSAQPLAAGGSRRRRELLGRSGRECSDPAHPARLRPRPADGERSRATGRRERARTAVAAFEGAAGLGEQPDPEGPLADTERSVGLEPAIIILSVARLASAQAGLHPISRSDVTLTLVLFPGKKKLCSLTTCFFINSDFFPENPKDVLDYKLFQRRIKWRFHIHNRLGSATYVSQKGSVFVFPFPCSKSSRYRRGVTP